MKKLAIVTTHPIQYYAPVFRLLHERQIISIKVFYTRGEGARQKYDPGFGKPVDWDIPLLDGYPYEWAANIAPEPGSHHFRGIINPELIKQIENYKADALLVFGWAYQSHLKILRYFKGKIPVYFRGDSTLLDEHTGLYAIIKGIFLKWVYRHINHAFYVGTNNKAYFEHYGVKPSQLSFAPHAVDNERFAIPHLAEVEAFKKKLGISNTDTVMLFSGKLIVKKDPELLLNAFLKLNTPDAHLVFAGDGPLADDLKLKAANRQNIHFIGFQNQSYIPVIYQACDVLCLPSQGPGETWGLVVNEAMACGKAVLVSNKAGCAADLVKNDVNGFSFKAGDEKDLFIKIRELIASKQLLVRFGLQSSAIIKHWSFMHIAQEVEYQVIHGK